MKMNMGAVFSREDGKWHDIIVKAKAPNGLTDILVGGGMVVAGICYLTVKAFKNGVWAYEQEEVKTMTEAGIIDKPDANGNRNMHDHYKTKP